jgi:hypothetical protein
MSLPRRFPSAAVLGLTLTIAVSAATQGQLPQRQTSSPTSAEARAIHARKFKAVLPGEISQRISLGQTVIDLPDLLPYEFPVLSPDVPSRMVDLVCRTGLVAVVTAGAGASRITEDQGTLWTEWSFTVDQVLRNNPLTPAQPGTPITVVIRGGTTVIQGRSVRVANDAFAVPFRRGGQYLLFLYEVSETGAYVSEFGFGLGPDSVTHLTKYSRFPEFERMSRAGLIEMIRSAASAAERKPRCEAAPYWRREHLTKHSELHKIETFSCG